MINEFKCGQMWKARSSSLSLSLYSTFKDEIAFLHVEISQELRSNQKTVKVLLE